MKELFNKYLNNICTPAEVEELLQNFKQLEREGDLRALIRASMQEEISGEPNEPGNWDGVIDQTYSILLDEVNKKNPKIIPLYHRGWFKIAAAGVLLVGLFSLYRFFIGQKSAETQFVKSDVETHDKIAGSNKAVLVLSNGSKIMLDSSAIGKLGQQGAAKLSNLKGQLSYNIVAEKPSEILYNTITTPRGGQYRIVLSDGTKVWLNAASSLHYPVAFSGKERKVELNGEGYFEVTKNADMPFRVNVSGKVDVEVLGTHFNISSYPDEMSATTLLEGSVKVSMGTQTQLLKPGQQALITDSLKIKIKPNANLEEVMAWKNGMFDFKGADLKTILRQVSRWYDVHIRYEDDVKEQFTGEISRNVNLSQLCLILESTNKIKLYINGDTVSVKALLK